jgi:hypothetical protein
MPTLLVVYAGMLGGCASGASQINNPWKDSSVAINSDMQTPSAEAYSKGGRAELQIDHARTWAPGIVMYHNGAVTHWPLWFEDPLEYYGNAYPTPADRDAPDNVFAWNWIDYFDLAYGPSREYLNIIGWPVSAIVSPPGTLMASDGRIEKSWQGYAFDERRAPVTAEPPDVASLGPTYAQPESADAASRPADEH